MIVCDGGNKGYNLEKLRRTKSLNVPKFTCSSLELFKSILQDAECDEIAKEGHFSRRNLPKIFDRIRKNILQSELSEKSKNIIDDLVKDLKFPLAVRSSSSVEDHENHSLAGIFDSSLGVNKDEVYGEVLKVAASLYNQNLFYLVKKIDTLPEKFFMGVIFQEMIDSDMSGVAFSANPVTGDSGEIVIEAHIGIGEGFVSGKSRGSGFSLRKDEIFSKDKRFERLRESVIIIEKEFRRPVDVEWAFKGEDVFILQARPIVRGVQEMRIEDNMIFSISELDREKYDYLSYLKSKYESFNKKKKLYNACDEKGVEHLEWKFAVFSKETLGRLNLREYLRSDKYTLSFNKNRVKILNIPEIIEEMSRITEVCSEDKSYCISLRENIINSKSALSYVKDGKIYIEVIKGKIRWLNNGDITPSIYRVSGENHRILDTTIREHFSSEYDHEKEDFFKTDKRSSTHLTEKQVEYISMNTVKLNGIMDECVYEWWIDEEDDKIFCSDATILDEGLEAGCRNTIYPGEIEGKIIKVDGDIKSVLEEKNRENSISVADNKNYSIEGRGLENLHEKIKYYRDRGMRVILLADKPLLYLTPILSYIDGMVLKEASQLCHLSLILREQKIPSMEYEYDQDLKDDAYVKIDTALCELKEII